MKQITFMIFSLLVLFVPGCKQNHSPAPLQFKAWEHNPLLTPGDPGSWDELMIALPYVVKHDTAFYLFYLGINEQCIAAMGLAISTDGYNFKKYEGNPVLAPDRKGADAFGIGAGVVMWQDSLWVMYYNNIERVTWGPGESIGRATAAALTGPWVKDENPVLRAGKMGEWDSEYLFPGAVVTLEDGSYRMYYSGGSNFSGNENGFLGMAYSTDGKDWKKYNDPATTQRPFADSDPVLKTGRPGEWDSENLWTTFVFRSSSAYEMYYGGLITKNNIRIISAGYATSQDGITWNKYSGNPVFEIDVDSHTIDLLVEVTFEGPSLIFLDSICLMYYDYCIIGETGGKIGLATARLPAAAH